jgi:hypothetical protein
MQNWLAYVFEITSHELINSAKRYYGEFSGLFCLSGNLRKKGEDAGCGGRVQAKFDEMFALRVEVKEEKPKKVTKKRIAEKKETNKKTGSKRVKISARKRK